MKNNTMQYRNLLACLGIVLAIDGIGCMAVVKGLLDYKYTRTVNWCGLLVRCFDGNWTVLHANPENHMAN